MLSVVLLSLHISLLDIYLHSDEKLWRLPLALLARAVGEEWEHLQEILSCLSARGSHGKASG